MLEINVLTLTFYIYTSIYNYIKSNKNSYVNDHKTDDLKMMLLLL